MSYSQAVAYVANENFKNLWSAAYKKYQKNNGHLPQKSVEKNCLNYDAALKQLIQRVWHCKIITTKGELETEEEPLQQVDCHSNILPALIAIETSAHVSVFFYPTAMTSSLYDCISYSPAVLANNYNKSNFLIYQICQLAKSLAASGLFLGNVTLHDFLLRDNLWLQLVPQLNVNIIAHNLELQSSTHSSMFNLKLAYDLQQCSLREYCEMWCQGRLSNFDYLSILNEASGRSLNNPAYHHIMPWVTDFSARNGANWRDLSKSKYRLNKGDVQLDLMFAQGLQNYGQKTDAQVPHHVSDFLSEITYFVYMARRTPQHILREHVRPIWVPAEYPISIQRLQEWTPDECIPQFYADPMIFKSIHEDLPDLELPVWATCPEDFVLKHREALETQHVSERLHHWIDLNFGYKLTGKAAIKSKNVCLSVVDKHQHLVQRGVVQLFSQAHPAKRSAANWFEQKAPRLKQLNNTTPTKSSENANEMLSSFYATTNFIELPKDYNPLALLHNFESLQGFVARTFPQQTSQQSKQQDLHSDDEAHSFTNQLFEATPLKQSRKQQQSQLQETLAQKRAQELQVLGCLIVELFCMQRLRPLLMPGSQVSFSERLKACRTVFQLYRQDVPLCLQQIVHILLKSPEDLDIVGSNGLPLPTSAQQMLEPILSHTIMPFSAQYYGVYALMRSLHSFEHCANLLELYAHFHCNGGQECARYAPRDRQRVLYERKIAECKVMACCAHLGRQLLEPKAFEQFTALELILPHIIELLTAEQTSILTAWHLFDPIAQALGKAETQQHLLLPIIKLYDAESFERGMISVRMRPKCAESNEAGLLQFSTSSNFKSRKSVKLYHHSFLLRLIVRFGLRCFLNNFITPLIEAVGGYKEPEEGTGLHYHSSATKEHLNTATNSAEQFYEEQAEHVFSFDEDNNSDHVSNAGTNENKSVDSFDMRPHVAEEVREECVFNLEEQLDKSEEELNVSTEHTKSPTIEIPASAIRRAFQLNTIDCDIGSRKSVDSFEMIAQQVQADQEQAKKLKNKERETISAPQQAINEQVQAKMSEAKLAQNNRISEMSAESLMWLSHRLGPVLTSCYITRNLLKMLSLCYVGQENLMPEIGSGQEQMGINLNYFSIAEARVLGDQNAARVLECLISITGLFGEEVILLQYFPHISELIALGKTRLTGSLEGAIISTLQLLKCIIPCLTDATLMERLKDLILDDILLPIIDLLSATQLSMPSGYLGRSVLARKLLDALYALCVRIGRDMSREHLCLSALRSFFLIFNDVYNSPDEATNNSAGKEEVRDVFNIALAHTAYVEFLKFLGDEIMQYSLENLDFILLLCHEFEDPSKQLNMPAYVMKNVKLTKSMDCPDAKTDSLSVGGANSFGSNVVGNRIEVNKDVLTCAPHKTTMTIEHAIKCIPKEQELDMVAYKFESLSTVRHLKGNWLAYWRHEVSRPEKTPSLSLKQIKLQSFVGHTNSVRAIIALDNENSFISASKDKTVKLWSLRSEGDGSKLTQCQFTYGAHKKSVHSLAYLEAMRLIASCDAGVHIWDPFIGRALATLDSPRNNPITVVKCMPSPSPLVVAGTAECSVKLLDTRSLQYVCDWRLGAAMAGGSGATVRCLCVSPSGNWLAVGLSSGRIVMLDARTGLILNSWRPMECDMLQLVAANEHKLISSALDHSLGVWHASDGILHFQLKPPAEPAHYLQTIDSELVFATTGNRIGIYADIGSPRATQTVTKLRAETFRGVLTSLAVLPLNRTFLAGNESGNIFLLC